MTHEEQSANRGANEPDLLDLSAWTPEEIAQTHMSTMHTDGDFQIQFGKSMYAEAARDANKCQGIFDFFRAHLSADWRIMATDFVVAQLAHDAEVNSPEQVEATVSAWDSLLNDKDGDVQAAAQDVVDQLLNHKVSRKLTVHQLGAVILSLSRA